MSTRPARALLKLLRELHHNPSQRLEACRTLPLLALQAKADEGTSHQVCKALEAVIRSSQPDDALEVAVVHALWDLETNLLRLLNMPEWVHSKNSPTEFPLP
jgi:hypothetical protein